MTETGADETAREAAGEAPQTDDRTDDRTEGGADDGATLELFGSAGCPYTAELREELEWQRRPFRYHDVERDPQAFARLLHLTGDRRTVPVLVERGEVVQVGHRGRGCMIAPPPRAGAE